MLTEKEPEPESFNPHWVGEECCRDYRIGNIVLTSVPDIFVLRSVQSYDKVIRQSHIEEFAKNLVINIPYHKDWWKIKIGRIAPC